MIHQLLLIVAAFSLAAQPSAAQQSVPSGLPPVLQKVDFQPALDAAVPTNGRFRDEAGTAVTLGDYLVDRPVVLAMVYYTCPMMCDQILEGIARSLRPVSLVPGEDYAVVAVSFNSSENADAAMEKKQFLIRRYPQTNAGGWHLLTGEEESIRQLAEALHFHYVYDPQTNMFAHAGGIVVLTPDGRVSSYLPGVDYAPRDLQFALMEAAGGRIGSVVDQLLLFCYQYNPETGRYGAAIVRLVRWGGLLSVAGLLALILLFRRSEERKRRELASFPGEGTC